MPITNIREITIAMLETAEPVNGESKDDPNEYTWEKRK